MLGNKETKEALNIAQMVLKGVLISNRELRLLANAYKQFFFADLDATGPTEELKE